MSDVKVSPQVIKPMTSVKGYHEHNYMPRPTALSFFTPSVSTISITQEQHHKEYNTQLNHIHQKIIELCSGNRAIFDMLNKIDQKINNNTTEIENLKRIISEKSTIESDKSSPASTCSDNSMMLPKSTIESDKSSPVSTCSDNSMMLPKSTTESDKDKDKDKDNISVSSTSSIDLEKNSPELIVNKEDKDDLSVSSTSSNTFVFVVSDDNTVLNTVESTKSDSSSFLDKTVSVSDEIDKTFLDPLTKKDDKIIQSVENEQSNDIDLNDESFLKWSKNISSKIQPLSETQSSIVITPSVQLSPSTDALEVVKQSIPEVKPIVIPPITSPAIQPLSTRSKIPATSTLLSSGLSNKSNQLSSLSSSSPTSSSSKSTSLSSISSKKTKK